MHQIPIQINHYTYELLSFMQYINYMAKFIFNHSKIIRRIVFRTEHFLTRYYLNFFNEYFNFVNILVDDLINNLVNDLANNLINNLVDIYVNLVNGYVNRVNFDMIQKHHQNHVLILWLDFYGLFQS